MENLIRLLPEHVANQIAAGEVVQRQASVVKELVENAIDAGATNIQVILQQAGRQLIQVIDNGKGMNEIDSRMCFERHATSKIQNSDDLFRIRTMGFRGEAMASIAAIAQVELKSRPTNSELGHEIHIAGGRVSHQGVCAMQPGTIISVKNLFFNVPARRNFLKSDQVELRHVMDAFQRIALAYPDVGFRLSNNNADLYQLPPGKLRQRIVQVMGGKLDDKLVPVSEETPFLKVHGFIGRPESAKKRRGEQFFFVNLRFIKSQYLHHAVQSAFTGLLPPDQHPLYFLFLELDPQHIDVNIHPTKTEIKFDDDNTIYAILKSAVKRSLGMFQVAPTIDFEIDQRFLPSRSQGLPQQPQIRVNTDYNPFKENGNQDDVNFRTAPQKPTREEIGQSLEFYMANKPAEDFSNAGAQAQIDFQDEIGTALKISGKPFQIPGGMIVCSVGTQLLVIHQRRAHERILFEHFAKLQQRSSVASQQLLFPVTIELNPADFAAFLEQLDPLRQLGFDVESLGGHTVVVNGMPIGMDESQLRGAFDAIIDGLRHHADGFAVQPGVELAKALAKSNAMKRDAILGNEQMEELIIELLNCEMPTMALNGKPVFLQWQTNELEKRFL
jgi:DNA mismatch repair protein MutL